MSIENIITILSFLTLGVQVLIIPSIIYFFFLPKTEKSFLYGFISGNIIKLGFSAALIATLGSLFFSEVAGYEPCKLCWFQRIFMYPQVVLLGLAWFKKDRKIIDYSLSLAVIGGAISLYHNYIYYTASKALFCSAAAPCTTPYILEFGYVTIPIMALTGFMSLIFILSLQKFFIKTV